MDENFLNFFKNCPKWYFHENNFFKFFIHLKIIFNELIHFSKLKKKIIKLILIKLNLFKIFKSILKNFPRFSWRLSVEWQTTRSGQLPHEKCGPRGNDLHPICIFASGQQQSNDKSYGVRCGTRLGSQPQHAHFFPTFSADQFATFS